MGKLWLVDESNRVVVDRNGEEIALEIDANRSVSYSIIVTPFIRESVYAEGKAIYFPLESMEGLEEQELDYIWRLCPGSKRDEARSDEGSK